MYGEECTVTVDDIVGRLVFVRVLHRRMYKCAVIWIMRYPLSFIVIGFGLLVVTELPTEM